MIIKRIKITNFKSLYGEHEFDFEKLTGLIKLYGPIGAGKTSLAEAIIYGLFGTVKGHNNRNLISWNCKDCEIELDLISNNKEVKIIRNSSAPLVVYVNGVTVAASNKRGTQEILEEEIYDVNKLAIERMCIISFNQFNSIANMNPGQTREFLDNIFGFKTFTEYNDQIVLERKEQITEQLKVQAVYNETENQIKYINNKKETQKQELMNNIDITGLDIERDQLIQQGKDLKAQKDQLQNEYAAKDKEIYAKMVECSTLGKQAKEFFNKFKTGTCPTCGQPIDAHDIEHHKEEMLRLADEYRMHESERTALSQEYTPRIADIDKQIAMIKDSIHGIDTKIAMHRNSINLINNNYDGILEEYQSKLESLHAQLESFELEINEWNEMNDLFSKTLRYKLLKNLIPQINRSIQYFTNKLDLSYSIEFDQEFKSHIYVENNSKEIHYSDLSTGQRKSIDVAIIFGIIQNVIANVNFSVFFLDELFSNMDGNSINNMLELLKESLAESRTIFVVNHNEMSDEYFNHKIKVGLTDKKITNKKTDVIVKNSRYNIIF